jgi:DNA-binding LacI/PurR family transcriptional regulator
VVLADLHNPVYAEILEGIAANGDDSQQLLLASGFRDPVRERAGLEFLIAQQVEGVLTAGPLCSDDELQLIARQVPLVVVGRRVPALDCVLVDDALGLRQAVEHLVELGHERIVHIDGGEGAGSVTRRQSYQETMRTHGLESEIRVMAGDYTEQGGRSAAAFLLDEERPPTAIVAANDVSAIGALAAARTAGVSVPSDLSIVGFDNTALAHNGYVDLTTVDYPRDLMGATARELLSERIAAPSIEDARVVIVPTTLIPRSTSGPPQV